MRSLIKFPLMALLCLCGTSAVMPPRAMAGSTPVALPDSSVTGVSDGFAPAAETSSSSATPAQVAAQINTGVTTVLVKIASEGTVSSVGGRSLAISPQQVSTIAAVLSATGNDVQPAIVALEQQLSSELAGKSIEITVLASSASDLSSAITSANDIILSMSRAELIAAIESPTFMALVQVLGAANQPATGSDSDVALEEVSGVTGILQMSLL